MPSNLVSVTGETLESDYKVIPQLTVVVKDVLNHVNIDLRAWHVELLRPDRTVIWSATICAASVDDKITELAPAYFQQVFKEMLAMTKSPILEFQ